MMDTDDAAKKLYEARKMRTAEEVKSFEEARLALFSTRNPSILKDLFAAFDDSTEQYDVMWGLIHDAEAFDRKTYLREMIMAVPKMLPHARDWVLLLHQRVLNSKESLPIYGEIIRSLPLKTMHIIRSLLKEISESKPKLRKRIQNLLKKEPK